MPNRRDQALLESLRRRKRGSVLQMIQTLEIYSAAVKDSKPSTSKAPSHPSHDLDADATLTMKHGDNGVPLRIKQLEQASVGVGGASQPVLITPETTPCHASAHLTNNCRNQFYQKPSSSSSTTDNDAPCSLYSHEAAMLLEDKTREISSICGQRSFDKSLVFDNFDFHFEVVSDCDCDHTSTGSGKSDCSDGGDDGKFLSAKSLATHLSSHEMIDHPLRVRVWNSNNDNDDDTPFEIGIVDVDPTPAATPSPRGSGKKPSSSNRRSSSSLCDNELARQIEAMVEEVEIAFDTRHVKKLTKLSKMSTPIKTLPLEEAAVDDRRCSSPSSTTNNKSLQFSKCFNNNTDTDQASSVDIPRLEIVSDLELSFDSCGSVSSDISSSSSGSTTLATSPPPSSDFADDHIVSTKITLTRQHLKLSKAYATAKGGNNATVATQASAMSCSIPLILYLSLLFLKGINPVTVCAVFLFLEVPRQYVPMREQLV